MHTGKLDFFVFNSVCLLALNIWYVIKFPIPSSGRQHNKCTLSPCTEGHLRILLPLPTQEDVLLFLFLFLIATG